MLSGTRELHDHAMDLFERGLLAARDRDLARSRILFEEALEREAEAADSVANDLGLEPTRSILHRSAASIALKIGEVQKAKKYSEAGLAGNVPDGIREELTVLRAQISVYEAATTDYRLKAPSGLTVIQKVIRQFNSIVPVNVVGLARALGLEVRKANLGPQVAGEIFPDLYRGGFCGYTIRVNASDPPKLKRLTVAHEIAHFLRHRNRISNRLVDDRMYRSGLESTKEREAEELALDLLMPRRLIGELRSAGTSDPVQLAELFQVPPHVMKKRLGIRK
jgi:hypothetical protein